MVSTALSWYDYILFTVILGLSGCIGIYFGCFGNKQKSVSEYLMGGRKMSLIPITVSLIASHTSGITLLGLPAEVYRYGASYALSFIPMILHCVIAVKVSLPVFFKLQFLSPFEYLERRFDNRTRVFTSLLFTISTSLFLPIVIYIPALGFSALTGLSIHLITCIVCAVGITYTAIGGLKTVVWTDTLQFVATAGTLASVLIMGVKYVGGLSNLWSIAEKGQRLDIFDFDLDPTMRDSFWTVVIGLTFQWLPTLTIDQCCLQKALALPTINEAAKSMIFLTVGHIIIKIISILIGLILYANYATCDPLTNNEISRNDQLLPYFVMHIARDIPGLSGIFIAGVFSAALSTYSATLNSLSGTIYEDFISKFVSKDASQRTISNYLKLIVLATGLISAALVLVIEHLGGLLQLSISLKSVCFGPIMAIFSLGMLCPKANSKGVLFGAVGGLIFISIIVFPAKYFEATGLIVHPSKPLSMVECSLFPNSSSLVSTFNASLSGGTDSNYVTKQSAFFIFRISHYYHTLISTVVSVMLGLLISYLTNKNDHPVDASLISPVCHFLLPKSSNKKNNVCYNTVDKALNQISNM